MDDHTRITDNEKGNSTIISAWIVFAAIAVVGCGLCLAQTIRLFDEAMEVRSASVQFPVTSSEIGRYARASEAASRLDMQAYLWGIAGGFVVMVCLAGAIYAHLLKMKNVPPTSSAKLIR